MIITGDDKTKKIHFLKKN